jgi:hypothetical protein
LAIEGGAEDGGQKPMVSQPEAIDEVEVLQCFNKAGEGKDD